jgi:hypothetical protein
MNKIPGPALCGFADYFEGDTLVGARSPALPKGPPPKKPYPKATQNQTVAQHATVLKKARAVLAKAHGQVKTAARQTLAKLRPPVSRSVAAYHVLGVAQTPKVRAATAKAQAAQAKAAKAKAKALSLAVAAAKTIQAAHASVTTLATHVKNQENVARKLSSKTTHGVHGYLDGAGVHGYIGVDANGNSPGDPGYDPTTDSTAQGAGTETGVVDSHQFTEEAGGGAPPTAGLDIDTLVSALPAGVTPMDQHIADMNTVPAVAYDGSKGLPDGFIGSVYLFTRQTDVGAEPDTAQIEGNAHFGYVWGKYDKKDPANGGIGWGSHLQSNAFNHVHGRFWLGDDSWHNVVDRSEAIASAQKQVDLGAPGAHLSGYQTGGAYGGAYGDAAKFMPTYGPLVGNPVLPAFKNMRVDDAGNMFWIASEAPDWLTWPLKAAAALTKAATDKAAKDAAAAAAAAQAKAAADAQAQAAAQAAQNALDEANAASRAAQAESEARGTTAQAQAQADTADAAAAAADAAAAQQDVAERQAQLQQDMAERQFQLQQAQAQAAADAQAQQQYGGGAPQYYDDGSGAAPDDGSGDFNPEAASDVEAANIEADAEVLGRVLGTPTIAGDDAVIGGDGEVIGLDQYGNVSD